MKQKTIGLVMDKFDGLFPMHLVVKLLRNDNVTMESG